MCPYQVAAPAPDPLARRKRKGGGGGGGGEKASEGNLKRLRQETLNMTQEER